MKFWTNSWPDGAPIPPRYAAGKANASGSAEFSDNVSPHLAWSDLPEGTKSLVVILHDVDVPSRGDDVNQKDREIPGDLPRIPFIHWVLIDLPPQPNEITEGEFSRGFTVRGKKGPATLRGARHGLNDFTGWFAGNADMKGEYFGYDGPFPPWNDSLVHHYTFTLYAVDLPRLPVPEPFTAADGRSAMEGDVLGEAAFRGTYTLNRRLLRKAGLSQ
jgi:Raf kinase inhibitor-like YbhB/YbcL family protein